MDEVAQTLAVEALDLMLDLQDAIARHRAETTTPGGRRLSLAEQLHGELPAPKRGR